MISRKALFVGVNGRRIAIDLDRIEMIEDAGDGVIHLHSSSDWSKIRDDYDAVTARWRADAASI